MSGFTEKIQLGILLFRDKEKETIWATDDNVIWVYTEGKKIVGLEIDGVLCEEETKELIKREGFPYTLAAFIYPN